MDSSAEEIFTTAPSQVYFPDLRYEMQIEEGLHVVHEALNIVSRLNDGLEILGAKPFAAQLAEPQCSATQVEPRVFAHEIQPHLAAAKAEILKAEKVLKSKWTLKAQKLAQRVSETEIEELVTALTKASLAKPDTRLVIAYPREPDGDFPFLGEQTLEKDFLGVIQTKEHVDFSFELPGLKHEIRIIYKPMSDDCLLVIEKVDAKADKGTDDISITNLDILKTTLEYSGQPAIWGVLTPSKSFEIKPGVWRILVNSSRRKHPSTVDILVLKRPYNVSIQNTNNIATKRQAADHIGRTRSAKRQRLSTQGKNREAAKALGFDKDDHLIQMSQNTATLQELQEGHTVIVETQAERYSLEIERELGKGLAAHVFSCRHSKMPRRMIAVKILLPKRIPTITVAECWKREKTTLEKLDHEHIVELKTFDGRMLLIGVEPLPPSLRIILGDERNPSFRPFLQPCEALRILQGLSSALAYLSTKDVVHNDIKPDNIAYCPNRGPVLLDFGMAASSSTKFAGGTPWYIPPEYLFDGSRGFAGDMWALGITMLCILGHVSLPETTGEPWHIPKSRMPGADRGKMESWLRYIACKRKELRIQEDNSSVGLAAVHSLVTQMLHDSARSRVKAAELHAAAIKLKIQ